MSELPRTGTKLTLAWVGTLLIAAGLGTLALRNHLNESK